MCRRPTPPRDATGHSPVQRARGTSAGPGSVEFASSTARLEPRRTVSLLVRGAVRSADFIRACASCNRIDIGAGVWANAEEAVTELWLLEGGQMPHLSHGICQSCLEKMEGTRARMAAAV